MAGTWSHDGNPKFGSSPVPFGQIFRWTILNFQWVFFVCIYLLVGGWTNPVEKYSSKLESSPSGWKLKKNIWNHHLVYHTLHGSYLAKLSYFTNLDFHDDAGVPFPETKKIQKATFWGFRSCEVGIIGPDPIAAFLRWSCPKSLGTVREAGPGHQRTRPEVNGATPSGGKRKKRTRFPTRVSMEVMVTIVGKLAYNLFRGPAYILLILGL